LSTNISLETQKPKKQNPINDLLTSIKALTIMQIIELNGRFNSGLFFAALRPILLVFIIGVFIRGYDPSYTVKDAFQNVLFCGAVFFFLRQIIINQTYLDQKQSLLYLPNTSHLAIIISGSLSAMIIFVPIFLICFIIFNFYSIDLNYLRLFESIFYAFLLGFSYLLMASFFCFNNKIIQQFLIYVPLILIFTSCVFFSFESVPKSLQQYFLYNPVVHTIEITRDSIFDDRIYPHINESYVIQCSLIMLLLSVVGYMSNVRR